MLSELFCDGREITRERILVLFFFSSDVAIRAVRKRLDGVLAALTTWTLDFIRERVCVWVQRNGGWAQVLRSGLGVAQQVAVIGMCAAVIAACVFYVKRSFK